MHNNDIILYDNYPTLQREQDAKENLFVNNPKQYSSLDQIPQQNIDNALYWLDMHEWQEIQLELTTLFKQDDYLLTGYFGSWQGNLAGGKFIRDF